MSSTPSRKRRPSTPGDDESSNTARTTFADTSSERKDRIVCMVCSCTKKRKVAKNVVSRGGRR